MLCGLYEHKRRVALSVELKGDGGGKSARAMALNERCEGQMKKRRRQRSMLCCVWMRENLGYCVEPGPNPECVRIL